VNAASVMHKCEVQNQGGRLDRGEEGGGRGEGERREEEEGKEGKKIFNNGLI